MRIFLLIICLILPSLAYKKDSLFIACNHGRLDEVIRLIKNGHDVNSTSGLYNRTPIFELGFNYSRYDSTYDSTVVDSILTLLMENGADINALDKDGNRPLHQFTKYNSSYGHAVRLVEAGVDINVQNRWGVTPLYSAISAYSNTKLVKYLIEKGADLTPRTKHHGHNVMHLAAKRKYDVIPLLLNAGGEELLNVQDDSGRVPIYYALQTNSYESLPVMEYMSEGVDMSVVDNGNRTLLDALLNDRGGKPSIVESIEILLKAGVAPNSKAKYRGFTSYQRAYHRYKYKKNVRHDRKEEARKICETLEASGYDFSEERKGVAKKFGLDILDATVETLYVIGEVLLYLLPSLILFLLTHFLVYKKSEKRRPVLIAVYSTFSLIVFFFILGIGAGFVVRSLVVVLTAPLIGAAIGLISGIVLGIKKLHFRPLYYVSPVGLALISWGILALAEWKLF